MGWEKRKERIFATVGEQEYYAFDPITVTLDNLNHLFKSLHSNFLLIPL